MVTSDNPQDRYRLIFGSNVILDSGSIVTVRAGGESRDLVSWHAGSDGMPVVSTRVDDGDGKIIAGITDSRPLYVREDCDVIITPGHLEVRNRSTGDVYFEFKYLNDKTVKLNGIFYLLGEKIVATDEGLVIGGGNVLSRNTFENINQAIVIERRSE